MRRIGHRKDYAALFDKVDLFLGEQSTLPTNERLAALRSGGSDPALFALYFQYGRYLLISSSRQGGIAGIANMLVQGRHGEVKFLPALPKQWPNGWVKGLRIKNGKTVDIRWQAGQAVETRVY